MIQPIFYDQLGQANFGWLAAKHHFSFGQYHDSQRMGFGKLRVINDDIIKPHSGFDTHPHRDMEIITYVRQGAISHKDSRGNSGRTEAGDVQVMSAGTGIFHSEHNHEDVDTNLYQIWIEPNKLGVEPRWDSHEFPSESNEDELTLLVSGDKNAPLFIHADAKIFAGNIVAGNEITQKLDKDGYLLVSEGSVLVGDIKLGKGDAAEITQQSEVAIIAEEDSEVLLIDV